MSAGTPGAARPSRGRHAWPGWLRAAIGMGVFISAGTVRGAQSYAEVQYLSGKAGLAQKVEGMLSIDAKEIRLGSGGRHVAERGGAGARVTFRGTPQPRGVRIRQLVASPPAPLATPPASASGHPGSGGGGRASACGPWGDQTTST